MLGCASTVMTTLTAYKRHLATDLLRNGTPQRLLDEIHAGRFGAELSAGELEELSRLVRAWMQRAFGLLALRDVLLIDPGRGARVYDLICKTLTVGRYPLPPDVTEALSPLDGSELTPQQIRDALKAWSSEHGVWNTEQYAVDTTQRAKETNLLHRVAPNADDLAAFLDQAEADGLGLTHHADNCPHYPLPADLDTLLPPIPAPFPRQMLRFEHPTGWRRAMAMGLALTGVGLLGMPLLTGHVPSQPAGLPLALMTLALMIGIHAGWSGYTGAFCVWLVANLPGFHHGSIFTTLWPGIPLVLVGLLLLALDQRVRAMWRWIRFRGRQ